MLTCDLDITRLRERYGGRNVMHRNGIIAINGPVPVTVLRSSATEVELPITPTELAIWINDLFRLKPHKGVSHTHPGVIRLSQWVENRLGSHKTVKPTELVEMGQRWLPDFFGMFSVDPKRLHAHRTIETIEVGVAHDEMALPEGEADSREAEALECLASSKPRRRVRGLSLLAKLGDDDLFDWCTMHLDDDSPDVIVAALRTMRHAEEGGPEAIMPFAESEDKGVRAAAVAALTKHAGEDAPYWCARGLKDPEPCVRVEVASLLSEVDPVEHHEVFELARHDPNPEIARRAQRLTAGKGYAKVKL